MKDVKMQSKVIELSRLSGQVKADLQRLGLIVPAEPVGTSGRFVVHDDLAVFMPLLSGSDIRLVPMMRDGCPIRFCTATWKKLGEQAPEKNTPARTIPAGGQADTLVGAAFGCLGELAERLSLCSLGDGDNRIHPEDDSLLQVEFAKTLGFSETQERRVAGRLVGKGANLDKNTPNWREFFQDRVKLTQLGTECCAQFPSVGILFQDVGRSNGQDFGFASTLGSAVWHDLEGARQRALLELVERDAVAQAWYNRLGITLLDRVAIRSFLNGSLIDFLDSEPRNWALCIVDTDLSAHVVAAISYESDGSRAAFGSAAGWNIRHACFSAVKEMLQSENSLTLMERAYSANRDAEAGADRVPKQLEYARRKSILDDLPLKGGLSDGHARLEEVYSYEELLKSCLHRGLKIWEFNATRSDLSIPCVKLISSDLCSWEPRFGKRRLYEGVVERGLRKVPATEAEFAERRFPF